MSEGLEPVVGMLPRLPVTKALRAWFADVTGKPCEIGRVPRVDGKPVKPTYSILHPLWARYSGPQFARPHADAVWTYQLTVYTERGDQAEAFHDMVTRALVGRTAAGGYAREFVVDGMKIMYRDLDESVSGDDLADEATGLVPVVVRFVIAATPA